jgi:hypothetical protein
MSGRAGQILAGVVTTAVLAGTSQAAAPDRVTEPTWKHALWIRSDALNQRYGLGEYRQEAAPTAEPSWRRALRIRGEAMNRTHPTARRERRSALTRPLISEGEVDRPWTYVLI